MYLEIQTSFSFPLEPPQDTPRVVRLSKCSRKGCCSLPRALSGCRGERAMRKEISTRGHGNCRRHGSSRPMAKARNDLALDERLLGRMKSLRSENAFEQSLAVLILADYLGLTLVRGRLRVLANGAVQKPGHPKEDGWGRRLSCKSPLKQRLHKPPSLSSTKYTYCIRMCYGFMHFTCPQDVACLHWRAKSLQLRVGDVVRIYKISHIFPPRARFHL